MISTESTTPYAAMLKNLLSQTIPQTPSYQNNLIATRFRALQQHFRITHGLLGEKVFFAIANSYAQHVASKNWDINIYGESFADLIKQQIHSHKANKFNWAYIAWVANTEYQLLLLYYNDSDQPKISVKLTIPYCVDNKSLISLLIDFSQQYPWLTLDPACLKVKNLKTRSAITFTRHLSEYDFQIDINITSKPF